MTTPELYEDVESRSYEEVISNLIAWLEIDLEERRAELEQAQRNYDFFNQLLETAEKLSGMKEPTDYVIRKVRTYLELLNNRRLIDKRVDGWEQMSREEQIEAVEESDIAALEKYGY